MNFESWIEFRRGEQVAFTQSICSDCGKACSGDTTTINGSYERPICDPGHGCMTDEA